MQPDPIGEAIAAVEEPQPMQQVDVTIDSTKRHVIIAFPVDMTDSELLEFMGWCGSTLRLGLAQSRQQPRGPQLVIARGALPHPTP